VAIIKATFAHFYVDHLKNMLPDSATTFIAFSWVFLLIVSWRTGFHL